MENNMNIFTDEILENNIHKWSETVNNKTWTLFCGDAVDSLRYICGNISRTFLESKYPFIAEELDRQNLYDRIQEIIKIPAPV